MKLQQLASSLVVLALAISQSLAKEPSKSEVDREQADFFEREVRPVLMVSCIECHGPETQEAELRLDSLEHLLKGNSDGAVLVPGRPAESRLVQAIRYDGDVQMPPDAKLPEKAIEALTHWVEMGAPWPETSAVLSKEASADAHWAYQPVTKPTVPEVQNSDWSQSPVDRFILSRLETTGLQPSEAADRRALIRRLSFDLTGLPPSPAEVEAFMSDDSPDAVVRFVDHLLESPQFGERWARYWLDIARYADTKGYVFQEDRSYKYAYVFRDWVIESLNGDLPYDQFLAYQLAADQLIQDGDRAPLAAMGFLTVGRRFLNNTHDIIDDRIDVVTRGMLGMTVACARCHDHKYDPIPTADYYSLYGVFSASQEMTLPLQEPSAEYQEELKKREADVAGFLDSKFHELHKHVRAKPGVYWASAFEGRYAARDLDYWKQENPTELSRALVDGWKQFLEGRVKPDDPVFAPWHRLAALSAEDFASQAGGLCEQFAKAGYEPQLNPLVAKMCAGFQPKSFDEVIDRYSKLTAQISQQWETAVATATEQGEQQPTALDDASAEQVRLILYGPESPAFFAADQSERLLGRKDREELKKLRGKITEWANSDKAPKQAMALQDKDGKQGPPRIFKRGNPGMPGDPVPRQFLKQLAGEKRQPFENGSGRLEMARAIVDPANPLTARVWVNRVWEHLIGQGLVESSSDFGLRSDPPSHPDLLDYLATRFVKDGWSTKQLVRQIVLSATYQQTSAHRDDGAAADPENRLGWRMNRRRLDFESLRDNLLAVSASIDHTVHGASVDINATPFPPRRTVYSYIDRQNLPGIFRTFDFASPDAHTPRRYLTTVPQQSLYLMNHPFAVEQAQRLVARDDLQSRTDTAARINWLYQSLYARAPTSEEIDIGRAFIEQAPTTDNDKLDPWARYAQVLLMSNEFIFVD
jgi:hypothetical protein